MIPGSHPEADGQSHMGKQREEVASFMTHTRVRAEAKPGLDSAFLTPGPVPHCSLGSLHLGACGASEPGFWQPGKDQNEKGVHWAPFLATVSCQTCGGKRRRRPFHSIQCPQMWGLAGSASSSKRMAHTEPLQAGTSGQIKSK